MRNLESECVKQKMMGNTEQVLNDNDAASTIVMAEVRRAMKNPRLCFTDLNAWQREVFLELVRQYKRENKIPIAFHSLWIQFDFYNGEGMFADTDNPKVKKVIRDKLYQREYQREKLREKKRGVTCISSPRMSTTGTTT